MFVGPCQQMSLFVTRHHADDFIIASGRRSGCFKNYPGVSLIYFGPTPKTLRISPLAFQCCLRCLIKAFGGSLTTLPCGNASGIASPGTSHPDHILAPCTAQPARRMSSWPLPHCCAHLPSLPSSRSQHPHPPPHSPPPPPPPSVPTFTTIGGPMGSCHRCIWTRTTCSNVWTS